MLDLYPMRSCPEAFFTDPTMEEALTVKEIKGGSKVPESTPVLSQ